MAIHTVRIGSLEDVFQYDDVDYPNAIETDQPIKAGAPSDPEDVLRKEDIGDFVGDIVGPSGAVDSNIAEFDTSTGKLLKDGGLTHANVSDAISKKHSIQHSITSTSDHTSTATSGQILKADANGLPVDATNTDAQVDDAVSKAHSHADVTQDITVVVDVGPPVVTTTLHFTNGLLTSVT